MKSCSFLAVIAFFSLSVNAQSHLKLYLNSGIGKSALSIQEDYPSTSEYQSAISDKSRVTCNAQLNFAYRIKNWIMETGLGYNLIQGFTEERVNVYNLLNEFQYSEHSITEVRRAHYLHLPLTVQYRIKKWSIGGGVYASYKMTDYSRINFYLNSIPNGFLQGGSRLTKFDYGLTAKLDYAINEKWGIQAIANFGLHDVSNGNQKGILYYEFQMPEATNRKLYNRQFLIGLNYALF